MLRECLQFSSSDRPSPTALLSHSAFSDMSLSAPLQPVITAFPRHSLPSPPRHPPSPMLPGYPLPRDCMQQGSGSGDVAGLRERSMEEVYHLWQMAGGQPEQELVRHGFIHTHPPIITLPSIATVEGELLGGQFHRLQQQQPSHATLALSLSNLSARLAHIPLSRYYPLVTQLENNTEEIETRKLPLVIREKDVEYQLQRIILFHRLLRAYPHCRARIQSEAVSDIPPLYRGQVRRFLTPS